MNNTNIEKITNILNNYIYKYEQIKNEIRQLNTNQALYNEIINLLEKDDLENATKYIPLLLNTIYGNNTYVDEFYNIIYNPQYDKKLNEFCLKIKTELVRAKTNIELLNEKKNEMYHSYVASKNVKKCFTYRKIISNSKDIYSIKKIIEDYCTKGKISPKEKLLLINEIELYNKNLTIKNASEKERKYVEELYNEIPNILLMGLQEPDKIVLSQEKKQNLSKYTKEIINQSIQLTPEEIIEMLKEYQKYNLEQNEYKYIITQILNYYIDELITLYYLLLKSSDSIYIKERNEYIKEYYSNLDKYKKINEFYNQINETIEINPELTDIELKEISNSKRLIYSLSELNPKKTKFINDMDNVPHEYYETIQELITKFKNGTIGINKIKRIRYNSKIVAT